MPIFSLGRLFDVDKKANVVKERFGSNPESLRQEAESSEPNISWDLLT